MGYHVHAFSPVERQQIPLYYLRYYEVAFLAKILRSCRRKGMDILLGYHRAECIDRGSPLRVAKR